MKAKEYAVKYLEIRADNPKNESLAEMLGMFFGEVKVLSDQRRVATGYGLLAIISELNDKWLALSRINAEIPENLFRNAVKEFTPDVYDYIWEESK